MAAHIASMPAIAQMRGGLGGLVDQLAAGLGAAEPDEHRAGLGQRGGPVGLGQRAGLHGRLLDEQQGLLRVGLGEPLGQPLQVYWLSLGAAGASSPSASGPSVSASILGRRLADRAVVAMSVLGRPLQGQVRVDPGHVRDALECTVLLGVLAELLPEADQDLPGEGALSSKLADAPGFHAGGGSSAFSSVMVRSSASPSAFMPVKRYPSLRTNAYLVPGNRPSSRNRPWSSVRAVDRPGAVAAVEDGRAGDGLAVGADDAAGEVAAGARPATIVPKSWVSPALPVTSGGSALPQPLASTTTLYRSPGQRPRKTNQPDSSVVVHVRRLLPMPMPGLRASR